MKKETLYKCIVMAVLLLILALWMRSELFRKYGFDTIAVERKDETGALPFTASFDKITGIAVCSDDAALNDLPDEEDVRIMIDIRAKDGTVVHTLRSEDLRIHTNGYTNTETQTFEGLPLTLNAGEDYTLHYEASAADTRLNRLTFLMYGELRRFDGLMIYLFIVSALLLLLLLFAPFGKKRTIASAFLLTLALHIPAMPLLSTAQADSFAHAYAASTGMRGGADCDSLGRVYIEESGIRNGDYLTYGVPLYRFWNTDGYGNVREKDTASALYVLDKAGIQPLIYLQAAALALTRSIGLSYRAVWFSPRIAVYLVLFLLLLLVLRLSEKESPDTLRKISGHLVCVFFLPSVLCGSFAFYPGKDFTFVPDRFFSGLFVNNTLHGTLFIPLFLVMLTTLYAVTQGEDRKPLRFVIAASAVCALATYQMI